MMHTVYGVRLKADPEVRYVGYTYKPIERRLREHKVGASVPNFGPWLRANEGRVEIFPIAYVADRDEAKAAEKLFIALCSVMNHRLFNRTHVDSSRRWDSSKALRQTQLAA